VAQKIAYGRFLLVRLKESSQQICDSYKWRYM